MVYVASSIEQMSYQPPVVGWFERKRLLSNRIHCWWQLVNEDLYRARGITYSMQYNRIKLELTLYGRGMSCQGVVWGAEREHRQ